ncbi:MAG: carbohydrate kinase family protein [Methanobacteriota archaeon]|nr:MAG: carbohydrate kinase family protein [Euryarchaeota archaeon]
MRKSNFLGVYGHAAIDIIYSSDGFPQPNTCVELVDRQEFFGGTGANLARIAATLGVKTALAAHVGDDFPNEFKGVLSEAGVDITDVIKVRKQRTPYVIMISDSNHNQIGFVDQGAVRVQDNQPLRTHTVDSSRFVHIGTGRPEYMLKVARRARWRKKTVCFDPAQEIHYVYTPETLKQILEYTHVLFMNSSEMETAKSYLNLEDDRELLSYANLIVNTLGGNGSRVITDDDEVIIGAIDPDKTVDTTGAGDGFRAGFYAGLSRGLPVEECSWIGASTASFVVENVGAQSALPTWEMVQRRAARRKKV